LSHCHIHVLAGFQVSPVVDMKGNLVNFTVKDSNGISYRERICILYVTPLTGSEANADSVPELVQFLIFEDFPPNFKPYLSLEKHESTRQ